MSKVKIRNLATLTLVFNNKTKLDVVKFSQKLKGEGWELQDTYENHEKNYGNINLRREIK